MLIACPGCGKRFSDRAPACPFCHRQTPKLASAAASPPAPPPPLALPRFKRGDFIGDRVQVIDVLGEGGFGIVYLVASLDTRSTHALKALRGELLRDGKSRDLFRKEAQIWIDLGPHPNLVQAHWVTEIDGRLYIAMEYVQSKGGRPNSLEGYLQKWPPSVAQALSWAIQFCHGMEHAVSRGVRCHRDIKPANILIGDDDTVRISDFGIAGLVLVPEPAPAVEPAASFGTPSHMSPEQFENAESCDERSDVYSFGVVLYQMAAGGRLPFVPPSPPPGGTPNAWYWHQLRALHQGAAPRALASPLGPVVARCLAKAPADRYLTFAALRTDLEALYRTHAGAEAAAPTSVEETPAELLNRGVSLSALGRYAEALLVFDRALAASPGEWAIWNSRGNALRKLGRVEEALGCFDKATALDALAAAPWHNKGLVYAEAARDEDALACFDRALKLSPRDVDSWTASGVVLGRLERATEQLAAYDRAIELDPRSGLAWFNRGNVLSAAGRAAEALESYDRSLACDPRSVPAWCGKGIVLSEAGRLDEAVAAYDEALGIDPDDARSLYNKGNALVLLTRFAEARACFDRAAQIEPAFPMPWYNRALCDYQLGRPSAATEGLQEFLRRAPNDPHAAEARRLLTRIASGETKKLELAAGARGEWSAEATPAPDLPPVVIPTVAPVASPAPAAVAPPMAPPARSAGLTPRARPKGTVQEWNDRGTAFFDQKRYEQALSCVQKALLLEPRNATALNNLANCYFHLGRRDEVLEANRRAIEAQPNFLACWSNRAAIESLMGLKAEAARSATEIIELCAGSDEAATLDAGRQASRQLDVLRRQGIAPGPRTALGWLALAYDAMARGRPDRALAAFDDGLRSTPRDPALWRWRGVALCELKRYEEALQSFDQGLEHGPADADLWHDKGSAYVQIRLYAEAVEAFDRAIVLDGEHAGAWNDRGKTLAILNRSEEARESLARAVLLAPHHPAPWQNKALLEESLGREADALASYREFLARAQPEMTLQIEHAKARVPVLEARVRAGGGHATATVAPPSPPAPTSPSATNSPTAPTIPVVAVPTGTPSATAFECLQRGEANLNQGQWEKALGWFRQALMHDANAYRAWAGTGEALIELQRWPEAAAHLAKAVALNPGYVVGWQRYAQALDSVGLTVEALAAWDKAIELAPGNLLLWNGRGVTHLRQGGYDDALANFDRALAIDPRYALAKFNKAAVEEKLGRPADAAKSLQQFLALATPNLSAQIQHARRRLQELARPG